MQFFMQLVPQQLNLLCCSCMSRGAMFLATCTSGDKVKVEGIFSLADRTKHCKTSCKRGVTLCNAGVTLLHCCNVATIVAKRTRFYFVQHLLQQKCCETWWLRGMLHHEISCATCVTTTCVATICIV